MTPTSTDDDAVPDMSDLSDAPDVAAHETELAAAVARLPTTKTVIFPIKHIGGGYDRGEVDEFLQELSRAVDDLRAALEGNREELAALRAENARLRAAAGADLEYEITSGAVGLLSQAQLIADKAVADAEQYARDLVLTARTQYRDILERAESSATQTTSTLPVQHGPAIPEIEYVRTYAQVAQIQLRSVLDALTEQVDRLGTLPQATAEPEAALPSPSPSSADEIPDEEPSWLPSEPVQPPVQRQTFISP